MSAFSLQGERSRLTTSQMSSGCSPGFLIGMIKDQPSHVNTL
jgi:hypothetical protein